MTKGYPDWLRAFLLLGKHDSDYLPILLGPDGSMYAVLQGEYEGALRTVKLDDQGRLSAFVIDTQDAWGQMLQVGNAELVARLGSIVRLDKRGTVMFMDDFSDGSGRWRFELAGTGSAHALTPQYSSSGGYSLRLTAPTQAGLANEPLVYLPTCLSTSFGLAAMLRPAVQPAYVTLRMDVDNGVAFWIIYVRLAYAALKVQVWNGSSAWVNVCNLRNDSGSTAMFHFLKIVGDISTGRYVRLLYDNAEYDLSAITMYTSVDGEIPRVNVILGVSSPEGTNAIVEFDDVIVTATEP
ncbi:MAG: hypothetical protein Q8N51_03440 [Gammaproteobacteria bacterium]|nr:hypothetical protein [Gammaproteobacteria bacterium]